MMSRCYSCCHLYHNKTKSIQFASDWLTCNKIAIEIPYLCPFLVLSLVLCILKLALPSFAHPGSHVLSPNQFMYHSLYLQMVYKSQLHNVLRTMKSAFDRKLVSSVASVPAVF